MVPIGLCILFCFVKASNGFQMIPVLALKCVEIPLLIVSCVRNVDDVVYEKEFVIVSRNHNISLLTRKNVRTFIQKSLFIC